MDRINEITSSQEKIKMVCLHGNHFSYYNDANGILKGYPDGSLRPYEAVTRAEYAVMLERFIDYLNK